MNSKKYTLLLSIASVLEVLLYTTWSKSFGAKSSAVLFTFVSLSIPFLAFKAKSEGALDWKIKVFNSNKVQWSIFIVGGLAYLMLLSRHILDFPFEAFPDKMVFSDTIPQIMVLVERFQNFEFPYTTIQWNQYSLFPTYLPLQWFPYMIPQLIALDYRIFAALCFLFVLGWMVLRGNKEIRSSYFRLLLISIALLLLFLNLSRHWFDVGSTVESFIAAYYLFLGFAILFRKPKLIWLGVLFCLFSRYAIVLWIPALLFYQVLYLGRRTALTTLGILILGGIVIYGPFLLKDWTIYLQGYQYHSKAALGEWTRLNVYGYPMHLTKGMGWAIMGHDFFSGSVAQRLVLWQNVHLTASILSVAVPAVFVYLKREVLNLDYTFVLLSTLKLYLVVFYSFIQIPYTYLFIVPVSMSLPLLYHSLKKMEI